MGEDFKDSAGDTDEWIIHGSSASIMAIMASLAS